ncbi:DUF6879 family protein [Amycolatopsis sp. NPDC059021]|uniref:DUF6879 family protein n=1 Tax=Amycolatopsis sp. NPDC059021 TaxID=3346704 RepID=UPI00366DE7ED
MNLDELGEIMDRSTRSAFRLETLPQYLVPGEKAALAKWRAGEPRTLRTPENTPWLAEVQERAAQGYRRYRVHILDWPLSDYVRFEISSYLETDVFGIETYLVDRHEHEELQDLHEDFWLMDDEIAVRMVYDDEGHFLHPERTDDVGPYLKMRDTALRHAVPLNDYLAARDVKLTI